jgi:type IV secretion system protein TrbL
VIGFWNPVDWAIDQVSGFVQGTATVGFELVIGGLVAWVVDAVVWVVGGVFNFFIDSTDPNVQADWFITGDGPYATTVSIGGALLLLFLFAAIVQGILSADVSGMLRAIALDLPVSILGMVGLVTVTQALIALTDALSGHLLSNFQDDIAEFGTVVASLERLQGGTSTALVVFLLGLVTVCAGLVLMAELVIRSALIYIVVALAPLVFAARLWPATRGATRKLLELLCALILSKLVIAVALAVAAAAAVGAGSGGEVTALPTPEAFAEDPQGSVGQAVGILLTAAAAFGVAAFSPLLIAKLMPLTEAAVVSQGVRGGPARAAQQGLLLSSSTRSLSRGRISQLGGGGGSVPAGAGASSAPGGGGAASGGGTASGSGGAAAGAGGGAAGGAGAAGPIGAAAVVAAAAGTAAVGAARKGATAGTGSAEAAADGGAPTSSSPPRSPAPRGEPTKPPTHPGPPEGAGDV